MLERITAALIRSLSPLSSGVERDKYSSQDSSKRGKKKTQKLEAVGKGPDRSALQQQPLSKNVSSHTSGDTSGSKSHLKLVHSESEEVHEDPQPQLPEASSPESKSGAKSGDGVWLGIFSAFQEQRDAVLHAFGQKAYRSVASKKAKGKPLHKGVILDQKVE